MIITFQQERDFSESTACPYALSEAIKWINANLSPKDVFNLNELIVWAENNHYFLSALEKGE